MKSEFIDALIVAHDVAKSEKADRHLDLIGYQIVE
jgi:hypothetical protein